MGLETIAIASLAATAIGTGVSMYGQYQQGKAQRRMAEYNAQMNEYNRQQLLQQQKEVAAQESQAAQDAMRATSQKRKEILRQQAQRRSALASGGVLTDTGSPLEVLIDDLTQMNLQTVDDTAQRFTMVKNLQTKGEGLGFEAYKQQADANYQRMVGKNAYKAGLFGSAGTLLSGAASAGTNYMNFKNAGVLR